MLQAPHGTAIHGPSASEAASSRPRKPERVAEGSPTLDSIGFRTPLAGLHQDTHLARPA